MTRLHVFAADRPPSPLRAPEQASVIEDAAAIAATLAGVGVRFERWKATAPLAEGAEPAAVLAAYADDIDTLKEERGYRAEDVISLGPDHPQRAELREKFLHEHTHAEDEVRFFVRGQGQFYLHLGGRVLALRCTRGDLLSVPAGTPHWFDMGPSPSFTAIRIFSDPAGWVAEATGSDIAAAFPRMDELE